MYESANEFLAPHNNADVTQADIQEWAEATVLNLALVLVPAVLLSARTHTVKPVSCEFATIYYFRIIQELEAA